MGFVKWILGLGLGFAIGYVAGRLTVPQRGDVTQQKIRLRYEEVMQESRRAAEAKQAELEAKYRAAKDAGQIPL